MTKPDQDQHDNAHRWLSELRSGDAIGGAYAISAMEIRRSRHGEPYLLATISDASSQLPLKCFNTGPHLPPEAEQARAARIRGVVEVYRSQLQVRAEDVVLLPPDAELPPELAAPPSLDPDMLREELASVLDTIADPALRAVVDAYRDDAEFMEAFCAYPGSSGRHHCWPHGLLQHTLHMLSLGQRTLEHYDWLDRDLVLTALFLHDSGKVDELRPMAEGPGLTSVGHLLGHISLGIARLERVWSGLADLPELRLRQLQHMLLAHHDSPRYGSPKAPMFPEAQLVQAIEALEGRMLAFQREVGLPLEAQDALGGRRYSSTLKRTVFVANQRALAEEHQGTDDN